MKGEQSIFTEGLLAFSMLREEERIIWFEENSKKNKLNYQSLKSLEEFLPKTPAFFAAKGRLQIFNNELSEGYKNLAKAANGGDEKAKEQLLLSTDYEAYEAVRDETSLFSDTPQTRVSRLAFRAKDRTHPLYNWIWSEKAKLEIKSGNFRTGYLSLAKAAQNNDSAAWTKLKTSKNKHAIALTAIMESKKMPSLEALSYLQEIAKTIPPSSILRTEISRKLESPNDFLKKMLWDAESVKTLKLDD
jgi:hypothetical protein